MRIFLLIPIFPVLWATQSFDFVEDALKKVVDKDTDPCDDFFRHACPLGSPSPLISRAFEELIADARAQQTEAYWQHLDIEEQFADDEKELLSSSKMFLSIFDEICQNERENTQSYLKKLSKVFAQNKTTTFHYLFGKLKEKAVSVSVHIAVDVRKGITETKQWVENMLAIAEDWVKDTPWAAHYNATRSIEQITSKLRMADNYAEFFEKTTNLLLKIDKFYTNCKYELGHVNHGGLFCQIYTIIEHPLARTTNLFSLNDNAFNSHPVVGFGFPNYYHVQHGREFASKVGYTGFTVGHELGHTFMENADKLYILTAFSREAQACVTEQFRKTCTEFKEAACDPTIISLDDDGADIIGLQLSYEFLSRHYGSELHMENDRLGVTNDQLFFYSYAFNFCDGQPQYSNDRSSHSAGNIRINVAAQHPGFKKAFGCSDDSRMMRSATKQCIIYGPGAPETRRKFHGQL